MADQGDTQLPTSLEEVESLVLQLARPGAVEKVANTEKTLQKLQRSPDGWQLAQSLLGSQHQSVRFFGALTFTVKLNTDAKSLSEDDAQALLQNLIGWFIRCLDAGEGSMVLRKLCSTLVAYFLQFSTTWKHCVRHLMYCLCVGHPTSYEAVEDAPASNVLARNISSEKARAVLWFATALVEEVGKTDSNSMKQNHFHTAMFPNAEHVVPLMQRYIENQSSSEDPKVRQDAIRCYQAWVSYSHRAFIDEELMFNSLQTLTKAAIMCLADNDLYETTIELFSEVLGNYSKFLEKNDMSLLFSLFESPWAQERYKRLVDGDYEDDSIQFGLFMIAFGDANVVDLAQKAGTDPQCHRLLSMLCGLLRGEGLAIHEDKIFVPALEFWNTFVETMIDFTYSEDNDTPSWFNDAQKHVMHAVNACYRKIQFPPSEEFDSWDSVDRVGFKDARRDVSDLLEQFYLITGIPILNVFIDLLHPSIASGSWAEIEAAMYLLTSFGDNIPHHEKKDDYLGRIFDHSLFALFSSPQIEIPITALETFLRLILHYPDYFVGHIEVLASALNITFGAARYPSISKITAYAIIELCKKCRHVLVPELGAFLQQFGNMAQLPLDAKVKEGIMEGIAFIVEAVEAQESQIGPLMHLLSFVESDVEQCLHLQSSDPTSASELGVIALRCLEGIAKGLQPQTNVVDLEKKVERSSFWVSGDGLPVQQRIISIVDGMYNAFRDRGDIIEACCRVFRCGFGEPDPGPFALPAETVVRFFIKADLQTPRIPLVIGTACSFMSSHKSGDRIDAIVEVLLNWLFQLLQNLGEPTNDPEIAQNGIDFISRLIPTYIGTLFNQQPTSVEYVFLFTLKALTGSDPLPKVASADFWSYLVSLPNQGSPIQEVIDSALQQLGPLLAQALVYSIAGQAMRSELDRISDPLKKLVARQVRSKSWLEAALFGQSFPSDNVNDKDKRDFLQKLMNLRGAKGTNLVVKDFWLSCRGSNFAYAS